MFYLYIIFIFLEIDFFQCFLKFFNVFNFVNNFFNFFFSIVKKMMIFKSQRKIVFRRKLDSEMCFKSNNKDK